MIARLLLVVCIAIVIALIAYFFYWNRLFAFIIAQVVRLVYWNQEASSIWVEIGSIHFSLLAGRILFKDFVYHSSNQSIRIVKGQIQWRYWIRLPTGEEDIGPMRGELERKVKGTRTSCRIQLSLEGMEWFLYNRTAAYDNILAQMEPLNRSTSRVSANERLRPAKSRQDATSTYPPSAAKRSVRIPSAVRNAFVWVRQQLPNLDPKDLLPLGIEVSTGSIVLGNPSTPSILVAEFRSAAGTFGVVSSRSKYDLYKQLLNLNFQNPLIRLVDNEDYADPMTTVGRLLHDRVQRYKSSKSPLSYGSYKAFARLWKQVNLFDLVLQYLSERKEHRRLQQDIGTSKSSGRMKKAEDTETPIGIDFSGYEYAIERKIIEAPSLELSYYVDVVGEVPPLPHTDPFSRGDVVDIGNGDTAPEWGFEIVINGGMLRYGPWADRQRAELQKIFFPSTYQNSTTTQRLKPGDKRVWTVLNVFIELRDETTLHIPFREPSKDWEWDGKSDIPKRQKRRENASIAVIVGDRSSINYIMPMAVGSEGYESTLEVHLDTVSVTSSLNDIKLVSAESCRVRAEMPTPLAWNGERTWKFSTFLRQPILYLLRDHINLFTDLGKDWASGPPTDWQRFVPTIYQVKVQMHHYEVNLYLNDHNIIDKPLLREENTLLTLRGLTLKNDVTIPSNKFRSMVTSVPFAISAPDLSANMSVPRWNTNALNAPKQGHSILRTESFDIVGSYRYHSESREDFVDQLKLDFKTSNTALKALGWAIRYFMILKDNYFGSFTHFSTLGEYLDNKKKNIPIGDPIQLKYRPGKHNMLQVEMYLDIQHALVTMPAGFLSHSTASPTSSPSMGTVVNDAGACLLLHVPQLQLHLRLHDFFMEMSLNTDPIQGYIDESVPEKVVYTKPPRHPTIVTDSLDIVANRLFGPLPRTATYLCIWEIRTGAVTGSLSATEAKTLAAIGNGFRHHYMDHPNAPAAEFMPTLDPDITFYKVSVESVDITWKAGGAAVVVSLPEGIKVNTNDLAADHYRKVVSLRVPNITTKVLVTSQIPGASWLEAGEITADAYIDVYSAPKDYLTLNAAQVVFVEEQDRTTGRVKRMVDGLQGRSDGNLDAVGHHNGVFVPQPMLPNTDHRLVLRPTKVERRAGERTANWRVSTLAHNSDSDEDDGMSEADRDARIANSRFAKGRPILQEDDISSGDESDDADLTDGDSIDSDWFDMADSPSSHSDAALLSYYAPLTRHYTRDTPPGARGSATTFNLLRDRPNLKLKGHGVFADTNPDIQVSTIVIPAEARRERNGTVIRVRTREEIGIKATPLLLLAYGYLETDVQSVLETQDVSVDALMTAYLSEALSEEQGPLCLVFDVHISSLRTTLLHHIPLSEGRPLGAEIQTETPSKLDSTAVLDISIDTITFTGCTLDKVPTIEVTVACVSASIDVSIDKRTLISAAPSLTILDASLLGLSTQYSNRSLNTCVAQSTMNIGHRGPEVVALIGLSLVDSGREMGQRINALSRTRQQLTYDAIGTVLKSSQAVSIIDTLSTIQPSYLVQSGTPWKLRSDPIFRLLFHLRNCIGQARITGKARSIEPPGLDEFVQLLNSRLSALEQDDMTISQFPELHSLFPGLRDALPESAGKPVVLDTVGVQFGEVRFSVLDPQEKATSELVLAELDFQIRKDKLELIQFTMANATGMSQSSFNQGARSVRKWNISFTLGEANLLIYPHLLPFVQHILRVHRHYFAKPKLAAPPTQQETQSSVRPGKLLNTLGTVSVRKVRLRVAAENLVFEFGVLGWQSSSTILRTQSSSDYSMNHAVVFETIYLQARSPSNQREETSQDILAAITCQTGKLSVVAKDETPLPKLTNHLVFALDELRLEVPRSVLRLYRFAEEWRATYLPAIEEMIKSMLSEVESKSPNIPASPFPKKAVIANLSGTIGQTTVVLQVMHGTWVSLEVHNTIGYAKSPLAGNLSPAHSFGLQLSTIIFNVSGRPGSVSNAASRSRVRLALPPISLSGTHDGNRMHMLTLVEFIDLKAKPSHWDTLLGVQQKFGQDFNDLVDLMKKTRERPSSTNPTKDSLSPLQYCIFLKMKGFRIGLEGLSSTLSLECLDIRGGSTNTNGFAWDLGLTGLTLSLASRFPNLGAHTRIKRSAFVTIDFKVTGNDNNSAENLAQTLDIAVTKIHAVMQPSSIGEVGDFVDHLQAELLDRQERRAHELAAFKEKTRAILDTFGVKVRDVQLEETTNWLHGYVVNVIIQGVGVAFPLSNDDLQRHRSSGAVKAFLFSISSIAFTATRGETGEAIMKRLCFQFIPRFNQNIPEDFAAESHRTRSRLLYPEMKAHLRSSTSSTSRKLWVDANVNGFILDLDSTIPEYVFSLIDVYRQGKERVERLSTTVPRTPMSARPTFENKKTPDTHYTSLPTSNVFGSLTFLSGKVRAFSGSASRQIRARTLSNHLQELSDEQVLEAGAEVFNLPVVSVWAEYRATPAAQKLSTSTKDREPSLLIFRSTVHSSSNTLRPQLLPFVTEVMNRIENRMRKISSGSIPSQDILTPRTASETSRPFPSPEGDDDDLVSSMQLSFSLRIDQSRLELTCQPDVNVVAALNWESGGFMVNVSPGAREVSFTGSVAGLSIGLRHGFLSEDCVNLDARNLAFNVTFHKTDKAEDSVSSISAILDTEFLGGVRFSRLQDILCFKAVWLDRIPVFNSSTPEPASSAKPPGSEAVEETKQRRGLSTMVLVRIRQIKLTVDLGQSITSMELDLKNAVMSSKLTDRLNEVSLFVEDVSISATGNLSGHIRVPNCLFSTTHRTNVLSSDGGDAQMLELKMTSGALIAALESDHQRLVHYRADPLEVRIFDDWSLTTLTVNAERPLQLSFTVDSPEIVMVATISTIPKMMSYFNKFKNNIEAQRQAASRESKTYWATRAPQPDNPLSAVAEAMLDSARSRFRDFEPRLSYIIRQNITLRLDLLRLVVFPRSMNDVEIAQFVGQRVRAQLDRLIGTENEPATRDLRLAFSSMAISKHTHHRPDLPPPTLEEGFDGREWLNAMFKDSAGATIVGLPAMNMHMQSEEAMSERDRTLIYDFQSVFIREEGMEDREDIFITLNMSLYAWLTVLRKNLTREMAQVRATEDWRSLAASVPNPAIVGPLRKKVPEPLDLASEKSPRSATLPAPVPSKDTTGTAFLSPLSGPSSARYPSIEQTSRTPLPTVPRSATVSREGGASEGIVPPIMFPSGQSEAARPDGSLSLSGPSTSTLVTSPSSSIVYHPRERHIERLTMRQLGEATPDVMHPFFMKKAGFNLEDSLPQYVHEYATIPLEEIMDVLFKLYSQQLLRKQEHDTVETEPPQASHLSTTSPFAL